MLDDRYYMRQTPFDARRSATVMLLIANVAAFIGQMILRQAGGFQAESWFVLSLPGLAHGYIWQLLTYQFMHAGVLHLLFNCLAIYVFGQAVEEVLGRRRFLALYFSSGVIGGLVEVVAGLIFRGHFAQGVVGASAAAFGLAAAFAVLFPNRMLLLFFIIPLRAKYILALGGALALYGLFTPDDGTAHAAHLGGMVTGVLFIRYALRWQWHWPRFARKRAPASGRLVKVQYEKPGMWARKKKAVPEDLPPEEFLSKEVDPILDKISAHGIQSLTDRERRILETARSKMAKR